MNYLEFKTKYDGQFVEVAGSSNAVNQCVDLANAYIRDVLGLPIVEWTNAQDFPKKCLPPDYEYILNTPTGVPLQGDIIVWKSPDNIGHIGICDNATASKFVSFDQNWPLKSPCKLVNHTYTGTTYNVIGWLRGKIKEIMTDEQKRILDYLADKTEGDVREAFGALAEKPVKEDQIKTLMEKVLTLDKFVKELTDRIVAVESDLQANLKLVEDWQKTANTANKRLEDKNKELDAMTSQKNQYKGWYETKCEELKKIDKMTAWGHIRLGIKMLSVKK